VITKTNARQARARRRKRVRARIHGTEQRLRLCVFRSSAHIYAQVINDDLGHTLAAASSRDREVRERTSDENENHKVAEAAAVGRLLAQRAQAAGVDKVVFDRAGYLYHGRVKALADGARAAGLDF
jgi:large subunit ribosomal protein L18